MCTLPRSTGNRIFAPLMLIVFVHLPILSFCQLTFPSGRSLNLVTSVTELYDETKVEFQTGKYNFSDYRYHKLAENIDSQWLVTACFNGECHTALEDTGTFTNIMGWPENSAFIAFHVSTNNHPGTSLIKYEVINKKDSSDMAEIHFSITYSPDAALKKHAHPGIIISPNPAYNHIFISGINSISQITIYNALGQLMRLSSINYDSDVDITNLRSGLYMIKLSSDSFTSTLSFIKG